MNKSDIGEIREVNIASEISKSYLDYAMSVIVSRALPDVRDGLKPVQRRILFAMHQMGLRSTAKHSKSAKVVGEVLGKYHPHGDSSVYEAMVRLAQDFNVRYPLVDGQGNFGSVDGDSAAAMRYTEAKLTKIADAMLIDIEKQTVAMEDNFDATLKEPRFLPALLPNLLLMGTEGIAVGMATKIPPHNLNELSKGIVRSLEKGKAVFDEKEHTDEVNYFLDKINQIAAGETKDITPEELLNIKMSFESEVTISELCEDIPGPDFPTGGAIYDASSLIDMYTTGRGKVIVRGIAEIKEGAKGKSIIEITELPYQVNKALFVSHIADLVRDKKIKGIAALRDESDKKGMSVVIELKRDAKPKSVLNNLYKQTKLQTTFPANFVALIDGTTPQTINLKTALVEYIKHRQKVIARRTIFDLTSAAKRAHILEGLKIALDNLDDVIATIRKSKTQDEAKENLITKFKLTAIQATAILDMQLRRLAALEREKIEKEYEEVKKEIERLTFILKNPKKVLSIIEDEITKLAETHGDNRKTKIYKQKIGEFKEEDLIENKETLITVTKTGYIKRVPQGTYKAQRRGGKGVLGMTTKEEDEIWHMIGATTHDTILFFTDKGRVFGTKAWEIAEGSRQAKGQALVNLVNLDQGESVLSIIPVNENAKYLIMCTSNGTIKRTSWKEFANLRSNGLIAIKLLKNDSLVKVLGTSGEDMIMLFTQKGKAIKFSEKDARSMGRATQGVRGINLNSDDRVIGMAVVNNKDETKFRDILTISEKGLGKRTATRLFPTHKRGGKGIKSVIINSKTGDLAAATMVTDTIQQIIVTSAKGQVIKLPLKNIPQMGRSTQGVILMRFGKSGDYVSAVTALEEEVEEES